MGFRGRLSSLAEKFSATPKRARKLLCNGSRYGLGFRIRSMHKSKEYQGSRKTITSHRDDSRSKRVATNFVAVSSGRTDQDASKMEFEEKSSRDGARKFG